MYEQKAATDQVRILQCDKSESDNVLSERGSIGVLYPTLKVIWALQFTLFSLISTTLLELAKKKRTANNRVCEASENADLIFFGKKVNSVW